MSEHNTPPERAVRQEAIDINDFVYAATGARVRRLTMPDGTHWFPAVDICSQLGYANTSDAVHDLVPEASRKSLGTVVQNYRSSVPAGHGLKKSMNMINLHGLIRLVGACTKPASEPLKEWVTDVIVTVQRDGSYQLDRSPIPVAGQQPLLLPEPLAEVIVRLEERNLRLDEEFAVAQREAERTRKERLLSQREMVEAQHDMARLQQESLQTQREMLQTQNVMARAMHRIADSLDALAGRIGSSPPAVERPFLSPYPLTAESVLADWKTRMSVTEDVWAVAIVIAPVLAERGEIRMPLESIAGRTGLTLHRVNECLRFMRKHACIRSLGGAADGAPVYVLNRP
jgi:prophage antirepressor-like protein